MFERVVLNLLSNAVKYTPEGSVRLTVRAVDDEVEVAVSDTGIGIDPSDVDRAFARFERLPAADGARSHEGAGIGLAMVKQLTELMGGTVAVCSEVGRGSTFTVRLPAAAPDEVDGPPGEVGPGVSRRPLEDFLSEVETWERQGSGSAAPSGALRRGAPRATATDARACSSPRTTSTCARTSVTSSPTSTTSSSSPTAGRRSRPCAARCPTSSSRTS